MTHRKWTRIFTLASASVATLCVGAWLSYQAAMQQGSDPAPLRAANATAEQVPVADVAQKNPAEINPRPAEDAAAQTGATLPEASRDDSPDVVIRASLPGETRSLFAEADPGASVIDPRAAAAPAPEVPPLRPADAIQSDGAQSDGVKASQAGDDPFQSVDPSQAGEQSKPDGARASAVASAKPQLLGDLGPIPEIIPLPTLSDRPVPVDGVPTPPRRPVGLAAAQPAPAQVASLVPVALPMSAAPSPQLAPAPQVAVLPRAPQAAAPKPAAAPKSAAPQPASAASENGFPNIANALAAVTESVGGADATLTPQPEAAPALEPGGGFKNGSEVYVRIFKREGALELWMKKGERFALYKSYPICKWSGHLGPKQAYADYQSPEGFYEVSAKQLNPHSHYHLSFDVGYPNAYDRRHGFSGDKIMVHGDCKSVGCFAMTNAGIDEIYGFVASALAHGQKEVPVHIFPFRMTEAAIVRESGGGGSILAFLDSGGGPKKDWSPFWRNLKEGYDLFERTHVPPTAYACGDRYEFSAAGASCARIAGR